jgi:UV DNA damage repair endonuclease
MFFYNLLTNFFINFSLNNYTHAIFNEEIINLENVEATETFNTVQNQNITSVKDSTLYGYSENSSFFRFQRALNPIFRYDYKLGNYFTKEDLTISPHLFTTISEVTGGIRKSS